MTQNKVFSAQRKTVTATYEFLDGSTTSITVQSLSTNEAKEVAAFSEDETKTGADLFEKIARIHLQKNDAETINRIIKEQYTDGSILEFSRALGELIEEVKKGKSNG